MSELPATPAPAPSPSPATSALPERSILGRLVSSGAFWGVVVAMVIAVPLMRAVLTPPPPELPVLGTLPSFALTDQTGASFGSEQLKGKIWVANFIFTRCPTICPTFTRKMATVQERTKELGDAVHLVSFSVDPDYDTPAVLAAYAEKHRANPRRWTFLTGSAEAIRTTVVDGLKISMGREGPADDFASIFHGTHFVLVDEQLRIRGYYRSEDADVLDRLVRDIGLLANKR